MLSPPAVNSLFGFAHTIAFDSRSRLEMVLHPLALGPCISGLKVLQERVTDGADFQELRTWTSKCLPAGECFLLQGRGCFLVTKQDPSFAAAF